MVPFDVVLVGAFAPVLWVSYAGGPGPGFTGCPGGHRAGQTWHPEPCVMCTCQVRESEPRPGHHAHP